ncbi:MAG: hypothetical protein AAF497_14950 [Planctomycetota bacterium]
MSDPEQMSENEIQELAELVASNLNEGGDPEEITQQLVNSGWERDKAAGFVGHIQNQLAAAHSQSGGGGGGSWLIWIGLLIFINVLSQIFGWGFIVY